MSVAVVCLQKRKSSDLSKRKGINNVEGNRSRLQFSYPIGAQNRFNVSLLYTYWGWHRCCCAAPPRLLLVMRLHASFFDCRCNHLHLCYNHLESLFRVPLLPSFCTTSLRRRVAYQPKWSPSNASTSHVQLVQSKSRNKTVPCTPLHANVAKSDAQRQRQR